MLVHPRPLELLIHKSRVLVMANDCSRPVKKTTTKQLSDSKGKLNSLTISTELSDLENWGVELDYMRKI